MWSGHPRPQPGKDREGEAERKLTEAPSNFTNTHTHTHTERERERENHTETSIDSALGTVFCNICILCANNFSCTFHTSLHLFDFGFHVKL